MSFLCVKGHLFDEKEAINTELGYACPVCWPNEFEKKGFDKAILIYGKKMLIPNKGRIIVQKIVEEKKEGNLILPDKPSNEPFWAIVENPTLESEFDRHMKVLVPAYAGYKITYEGKEFIILKEEEILCYY